MGINLLASLIMLFCGLVNTCRGENGDSLATAEISRTPLNRMTAHHSMLGREAALTVVGEPYRAFANYYLALVQRDELAVWDNQEVVLYRDLLVDSIKPEFLLAELTVYPVDWFASETQTYNNQWYQKLNIPSGGNLLAILSDGIQEPWSVSIFAGMLRTYWELNDDYELQPVASGLAGPVLTGGWQQIFDGYLVRSDWARLEWKLKGEQSAGTRQQHWDLKLGFRWFGITDLDNVLTLSLNRGKYESHSHSWRLSHNSETMLEWQIVPARLQTTRVIFAYGKYLPVRKLLLGLKAGIQYENRRRYVPSTGFSKHYKDDITLILHPVIIF